MDSDGVGKMKSKKSKDSGKPYERPKSLLRRVGTTLKDLLTPSWYSQTSGNSASSTDDDSESSKEVTVMQTEETNAIKPNYEMQFMDSEPGTGSVQTTRAGIVVECDGYEATFDPSVLSGARNPAQSLESSITRPSSGSTSTVTRPDAFRSTTARESTGPGSRSSSIKRGATTSPGSGLPLDTSYMEHQERSGTPFKKRCIQKGSIRTAVVETSVEDAQKLSNPGQPAGEMSFLWSTKTNPSSASCLASGSNSRTYIPRTPVDARRPRFDTTTFAETMSNMETSMLGNSSLRESPFYKGKTAYGGASARNSRLDSGYQVVPAVRQQATIQPAATTSDRVSLSATAKIILQGLEKSEAQRSDGQAVPSFRSSVYDSPLSFAPSTFRRNSLQIHRPPATPRSGPPVRETSTPTAAIIKRSIRTFNLSSENDKNPSRMDVEGQDSTSGVPSSAYSIPQNSSSSTHAPGKMKREQTRMHYSNKAKDDGDQPLPNLELSKIALPVTNLKPLVASGGLFGGDNSSSRDGAGTGSSTLNSFTFSNPIATSKDSNATRDDAPKSFRFSSPIDVVDHQSKRMASTSTAPLFGSSSSASQSKSPLALDFHVNNAVRKPQPTTTEVPPSIGSAAAASDLKTGSVMELLGKSATNDKKPLNELFKASSDTWSCPDCFVANKATVESCPCCGGSKPAPKAVVAPSLPSTVGTFKSENSLNALFKPPTDSWACPTCSVTNKSTASECPCCETKRPAANKPSSNPATAAVTTLSKPIEAKSSQASTGPSLASMFKKPEGAWSCPTCFVPNEAHHLKCCACEEPKPGAKPSSANGCAAQPTATSASTLSVQGQGFKFGTTSSSGGSSAFTVPSASSSGSSVAPTGGFKMSLPSGGWTGFGSSSFGGKQQTSSSEKEVPASGGFKLPDSVQFGKSTGDATKSSDKNDAPFKPSFPVSNPSSVESKASGFSFNTDLGKGGPDSKGTKDGFGTTPGMFGQKMESGSSSEPGFKFGGSAFGGEKLEYTEVDGRPPLRPDENTSREENSTPNTNSTPFSSTTLVKSNMVESVVLGSSNEPFSSSKTSVGSLFGLAKTSSESSLPVPKFGSAASGATPLSAFGIPSTLTSPSPFSATQTVTSVSATGSGPTATATLFAIRQRPETDKTVPTEPPKQEAFALFGQGTDASRNNPDSQIFKFGQPPKDESKPAIGGFTFGQTQNSVSSAASNPSSSGLFSFGQTSNLATSTATISPAVTLAGAFNVTSSSSTFTSPHLGFAATTSVPAAAPSFSFGATPSTSLPSAVPGFSFGTSQAPSAPTAGSTFKFGASQPTSAAAAAPGFGFGITSQASSTPSTGTTFKFGASQATTAPAAASAFGFGTSQTSSAPATGTAFNFGAGQTATVPSTATFNFGPIQTITAPSSGAFNFGASQTTTAPSTAAFNFGANQTATAPSTASFNFGASQTTTAPSTGAFSFGASQATSAVPAFKFGANPATSAPGAQPALNFGSGQTAPAPTFNFGAAAPSNSSGPFTFGAMPPGSVTGSSALIRPGKRSLEDDGGSNKKGRSTNGFGGFNPAPTTTNNNTAFFGAKPAPAAAPAFGGPTNPTPSVFGNQAASSFTFPETVQPPAFGAQHVNNVANGSAANAGMQAFGATAQPPSAPQTFNFSGTPNFNFGVMPTNQSGNVSFNAPPSSASNLSGRLIRKGVRRTAIRK